MDSPTATFRIAAGQSRSALSGRWSEEAVGIFPLPPGRCCVRQASWPSRRSPLAEVCSSSPSLIPGDRSESFFSIGATVGADKKIFRSGSRENDRARRRA